MALLDHRVLDARNALPSQPGGQTPESAVNQTEGVVNQTESRRDFPWKTLLFLIGMVATSVIVSATTVSIVRRRRSQQHKP
jgi:hypothetical protein